MGFRGERKDELELDVVGSSSETFCLVRPLEPRVARSRLRITARMPSVASTRVEGAYRRVMKSGTMAGPYTRFSSSGCLRADTPLEKGRPLLWYKTGARPFSMPCPTP